jgi:hypothetical protein
MYFFSSYLSAFPGRPSAFGDDANVLSAIHPVDGDHIGSRGPANGLEVDITERKGQTFQNVSSTAKA